ncbi:alpha/beta hydrolase [Shewanella sp. A32]|uniref:alpha/beta hydrolase n=1 Tax=Shewanella sp. A32 TaxID=3031327 RepID=UPI0023BA1F0A|nr:alpha/beta hydrolase [Shewanella sp. A32]MDF0534181.1 alpha/beta hydrolase [Shewanella sp. A32]
MANLRFLAGPIALKILGKHGLKPQLFQRLLAASGGPKWLGIAGLDEVLFSEFFREHQTPLHTYGASSGAWRLACLAQQQPLAALQRLEQAYILQRYDTHPTREQVSQTVRDIVSQLLGAAAGSDIVSNTVIRSHWVVCRARHLNTCHARPLLASGLLLAGLTNLVNRRSLSWHFQRQLFTNAFGDSQFAELSDLPTQLQPLSVKNIRDVLQATGSIPLWLAPVTHIAGVGDGVFYDGGITDCHFDLPLTENEGLTLYPHFYSWMAPGWFDKALPWRRARANLANALVVAPMDAFVASLPGGKLPDRKDFQQLDSDTRIAAWQQALSLSRRLGEEFLQVWQSGAIAERLEPL